MAHIGTPLSPTATKVLMLGSGELGKEVVIELQRLGVEVIAVDRYKTPGHAGRPSLHSVSMLDGQALRRIIETEKPDYIVPEIEAIATDTLVELEAEGHTVIPTAKATRLTMNREGIRRLAAEELGLATSPYRFAETWEEYLEAIDAVGPPCVVKPIMSSSGKGQSVVRTPADAEESWRYAQEGGRTGKGKVIVEGFVDFDYEITLLTVRHAGGTTFCDPIGHIQKDGDYQQSWQPQPMSDAALAEARRMAEAVTGALGGRGIFGVELFIKGDTVYFSEVSPRPHDTGLVTLISQGPLGIRPARPRHSRPARAGHPPAWPLRLQRHSRGGKILPRYASATWRPLWPNPTRTSAFSASLKSPASDRMGVGVARAESLEKAVAKAKKAAARVSVEL